MFVAHAVRNAVEVTTYYQLEGEWWIETPCADYDAYQAIPVALEFEGRRFGRTGWNSDRNVAYFCTRKPFALTA